MATKRKASAKREKAISTETHGETPVDTKPSQPQFVTQVVEELPVNDGVDVSSEALETIKEKAEEIEEVVEEIQEEHKEDEEKADVALHAEPENGETIPVEDVPGTPISSGKQEEDKEMLSELFTKEPSPEVIPDITEQKRIGAAPVFLWAVIIIGVALLTGGTLLVVASGLPKVPAFFAKPTPTPTPSPTPIPTPAAAARSDITLQILNGGGTSGSAGKAKTFLEEKGYTVSATGNTDEYTYKKTEVHVKADKEAYLELLKKDVSENYTLGTSSADLPSDSSYDAQVIVGKE
ncbi:MAG: LytR C-terminal domain-containing protein [Patescibacteria group bacterium]